MSPVIGWYAHHVGAGHVARARLVGRRMRTPVVILSSAPRPPDWPEERWVALRPDDASGGEDHEAGGVLHWAPLRHRGYGHRMAAVAAWVGRARPALLVSDVSVEITMLVRALGVPVAAVVMAGDRQDRPHQTGYDAATSLFAAWPADVQPVVGWRTEWSAKTVHLGAFSRFDSYPVSTPPNDRRVTVLWGRGGTTVTADDLAAAAAATPAWSWSVCRETDPQRVLAQLHGADVVVCHAGQNVLAEVAAVRRRAVVVPEARPHDEQHHLVRALHSLDLATGLSDWPRPDEWEGLLDNAMPSSPERWTRWNDGHGATRFAQALDRTVAEVAS